MKKMKPSEIFSILERGGSIEMRGFNYKLREDSHTLSTDSGSEIPESIGDFLFDLQDEDTRVFPPKDEKEYVFTHKIKERDMCCLWDCLIDLDITPTYDLIFDCILSDSNIRGLGLSWGFGDTPLVEEFYENVKKGKYDSIFLKHKIKRI